MTDITEKTENTRSPVGEKKKGRGGRPKVAIKREKNLVVRMTQAEFDRVSELAGNQSVSDYARTILLDPAARFKLIPPINMAQWTELSPVVSNLNQLAHHANSGNQVLKDLEPNLVELSTKVDEIRLMLLDAFKAPIFVTGDIIKQVKED